MTTVLVFPAATAGLVRRHVPAAARVLAVDAGAEACLEAGLVPEAVVGDMDSVSPATLAALEAKGARIVRHPAAKRDTDAALALRLVEDEHVVFLGSGGGRPDHALANLHLLHVAARRARVEAIDANGRAWVATPERPVRLDLPPGSLVSVLPLTERAEGVRYLSLAWMLEDATMELGDPYGVSNLTGPAPQEVHVRRGALLVLSPSER